VASRGDIIILVLTACRSGRNIAYLNKSTDLFSKQISGPKIYGIDFKNTRQFFLKPFFLRFGEMTRYCNASQFL